MAYPLTLTLRTLLPSSCSSSSSPSISTHVLLSPLYNNPLIHQNLNAHSIISTLKHTHTSSSNFQVSYRFSTSDHEEAEEDGGCNFDEAVALFNSREYYKCHDFLEALWIKAEEPTRTLLHGILQCAVGLHHLFNKNHKGAMMELGEGLCKLRKMNFETGPFLQFEQDISATLDFMYQTQLELAACGDDMCLAMDRSERSYQLLGGYAAGQRLYSLESDSNGIMYIVLCLERSYGSTQSPRVKLPLLTATQQHLLACEYQ